ncbi:hypothetical protein TNCV_4411611 [Trichonephila clavipes]|nr:hypothetical protein TNCV_4411611 [Trichonephila clavipes]
MEVAGVLVWQASCLVVVHTFTSSTQVQSTGPVIVTRFFFPYCASFRGAMGLQFLFMDDNAPCHRTVARRTALREQTLGSSYLTTSNDSGASIGAARRMGKQCLNNSLTPSFSAWADAVETCLAVRGDHIPYLRPDVSCWTPITGCFGLQSHCRLHATFFNQASFYPSDFSFSKCCLHYTCPYVLGILR